MEDESFFFFLYCYLYQKPKLNYAIFILLLAASFYYLPKWKSINNTGLSPRTIRILLFIKLAAGLLLGWITHRFYKANDYWDMNKEGFKEYQLLKDHPMEFLTNLFYSPYTDKYGRFFNAVGSYWNDLRNNIVIKLVALSNLISGGSYYLNSLLFNICSFLGCIFLFKLFIKIFPEKYWQSIVCAFLIPSTLYFTSGIHKDLLVFTSLCFYFNYLHRLANEKYEIKLLIKLFISLLIILLVRNFVVVPLLPLSLVYLLAVKSSFRTSTLFISVALLAFITLLIFDLTESAYSPLQLIVDRQYDFLQLEPGDSQLVVQELQPNLKNFVLNLPTSLEHVFLRPYIWEQGNFFYLPIAVELMLLQLLLVVLPFYFKSSNCYDKPLLYLFVFFSLFMFVVIGFTIPNLGAIVRYRSIYLPFLAFPLLCSINWSKLKRIKRMVNINM